MAENKEGWVKLVDEKLKKELELAAHASYDNGCELMKDARILFESQRFSRATALAILAEEEFCKAFTLKLSADNYRWDSSMFKGLHSHASKQGLAEAVVSYSDWEKETFRLSVGIAAGQYPDENKVKEIVLKAKKRMSKPIKDHLKQDALYVSISKDGKIKSQPKYITKEQAESSLLNSDKFEAHVAIVLGDESAMARFFTT